jgi:two-component system cell cycle sensor histidine kinase/response regulator CckA
MCAEKAGPLEVLRPGPDQGSLRERRLSDSELRRVRERFHLAALATQDLIWDWDVLRAEVSWAGVARPFFEGGPEQIPVRRADGYPLLADLVHPEDLARAATTSRAAFESGAGSWELEYRLRTAEGCYAHVGERAFIVRDDCRRPVRVVGAMRDISQRKVSEEATTRLAAIVASANDAIVGKTLDGIVTSWNAAAERIFGYSEKEMVGQSIFRLIPAELHDEERELLARIRRGEQVEFSVTDRIRKDGERISISVTVSPIWDASGRVIGASSIKRDHTERKRAAEELARREERYRALVTATSSIVWTTDREGKFTETQLSWEQYTGQPWEDQRGFGWMNALYPEDRAGFKAAWAQASESRSFFEINGRVWRQTRHRYRHFHARVAPVLDLDGSVREWVCTLTDVEEQRSAEERLRQAERLESVGRLAGGVAHEANNQMTVVLGASAFLSKHLRDQEARADLEHIRRAAQRTAAITQQLLAFSRRQILQPQVLDLNAAITAMEPILQRALGETSRVVLRLADDLGKVMADPGQLDQVLLNLALNARDAMPGGGVLTIETVNVVLDEAYVAAKNLQMMRSGPYAMLMLSDTGRGMDRETLNRVFEPFFTTKDVGEGTGLGLSTVYGIVKQSGGFIWAYSEPGHGTAFKIYLPLIGADTALAAGTPLAPAEGGKEVVLIAEDDSSVRGVLARTLRDYGYTVLEAADGEEALEVAARESVAPDLLIADVVMPRINGRQLWGELSKRWPELPVLFISGYTGYDAVSRGLLEEGREFMQKPLDPDALARKVRMIMNGRKLAAKS